MRRLIPALLLLLTLDSGAQTVPAPPSKSISLRDLSLSLEGLTRRVRPAVVQVFTTGYAPISEDAENAGSSLLTKQRGIGSGVILSEDGFILTNAHVVEGGRSIQARLTSPELAEGSTGSVLRPLGGTFPARVAGVDRETDLALLKIEGHDLPHLALANSDNLRQGQLVMAFGSPLGLEGSVSMGVVSSVARQLRPDDAVVYIQTDAPINPGNSGGPLVNDQGEVVGINTMILSQSGGSEGIGFAVPSNIARSVYNQLKSQGHVRRGQIGVNVQNITPAMAAGLNLRQNSGVIVSDVVPGGPAADAGVKVGDIVTGMNGRAIENARQMQVRIYGQLLKQRVSLDVLREDRKLTLDVPVVERPEDPFRFTEMADPVKNLVPRLGILAIPLTKEIAEMVEDLRFSHGLLVAARTTEAAAAGLQPGDVIFSLNRVPLVNIQDILKELERVKPGDPAVLQVQRGPRMMYLTIEPD